MYDSKAEQPGLLQQDHAAELFAGLTKSEITVLTRVYAHQEPPYHQQFRWIGDDTYARHHRSDNCERMTE